MRIVSICPSNTEIVDALGLAHLLVGCDRSSDYPPSISTLPRVGPDLAVDVAAIAALKPDLVLSSLSVPGMEKNLKNLDSAGLPHVVVDTKTITGLYENLRLVGRLLGAGAQAETIITSMQARLTTLTETGKTLPPAKVYVEWWPKPVIVPGKHCWTTEMIEIAGGQACFGDLDVRSTPVHDHDVPPRNPDVLLTCWCGVPHERQKPGKILERAGWQDIPGVRLGHVWAAEERFFGRPGPRLVEGIVWLQARLIERAAALAISE